MYYVQAPKIGSVYKCGTKLPFVDYLVDGNWIMNLCQARKITYEDAKSELIHTAKNLTRVLPNLDAWWHAEKTFV